MVKCVPSVRRNCRGGIDHDGLVMLHTWHEEAVPTKEIARRLRCTPAAVRWRLCHESKPRVPPVLRSASRAKRRKLVLRLALKTANGHFRRQFPSCESIARCGRREGLFIASTSTVRRDLKAQGVVARKRPRGPARREGDALCRLRFCRQWQGTEHILFSDEKMFDLNDHGSLWQWCCSGEQPQQRAVARFTPKVHVWAVIGVGIKELVVLPAEKTLTATLYIRLCLSRVLFPLIAAYGGRHTFMQDGARVHTARRSIGYLQTKGIKVMTDWPARSPDLNPLENLWALVQRRVSDCGPSSRPELIRFVRECWDVIPQESVDRLVLTFGKRCAECIERKGK